MNHNVASKEKYYYILYNYYYICYNKFKDYRKETGCNDATQQREDTDYSKGL